MKFSNLFRKITHDLVYFICMCSFFTIVELFPNISLPDVERYLILICIIIGIAYPITFFYYICEYLKFKSGVLTIIVIVIIAQLPSDLIYIIATNSSYKNDPLGFSIMGLSIAGTVVIACLFYIISYLFFKKYISRKVSQKEGKGS